MRWSTIYQILVAAATLSQALIIPSDISDDGVYKVITKTDGTEVHTKVAGVSARSEITSIRSLHRRASSEYTWCGCGTVLDPARCDDANADLQRQLVQYGAIGPGLSYYSIRGNVVAFACSRDSVPIRWGGRQIETNNWHITQSCGPYTAGTLQIGNSYFGYMRYANGVDFCRDSDRYTRHTC
jgi:hypothetical protein